MNAFIISTMHFWKVFVDLDNDNVCHARDWRRDTRIDGKIEISMLIHRRDTHHHNVYREKKLIVGGIVVKYHRNVIAESPVTQLPFIGRAVPAVVYKMLLALIALSHRNRSGYQIAAYFHIMQHIPALRQCPVQKHRLAKTACIVYPVTAFYYLHCLVRSCQLCLVFHLKIVQHRITLHSIKLYSLPPKQVIQRCLHLVQGFHRVIEVCQRP